jgi:hypothetical protein
MKILFLIIFIHIFNLFQCVGQSNTYEIVNSNNVENIQSYVNALNDAILHSHRFQDQRRIITFESGVEIELYSINELNAMNFSLEPSNLTVQTTSSQQIWAVSSNDKIIIKYESTSKKR